jgi:histone acetyltransferase MYST1
MTKGKMVPDVGDTSFMVLWDQEVGGEAPSSSSKGSLKAVELLVRRPLPELRVGLDDTDVESLPATALEYYVHYVGVDRRMDEWVGFERLLKAKVGAGGGDSGGGRGRPSKRAKLGDRRGSGGDTDVHGVLSGISVTDTVVGSLESDHDDHITRVKNIQSIELGGFDIMAWYYSPYPQDVCSNAEEKLFICEFCLSYMDKSSSLRRHASKCHMRSPPGREIYRHHELSLFEVDGKDHKVYCQNLCLLSKLFLDHKTLYYDVDPFLFYILCEVDNGGCHVVGYFSKEKNSNENYNLSCILTYPPYQRKGYGKYLISLSYELTKREKKTGSPEKPISDLGLISYKSYWSHVLLEALACMGKGKSKGKDGSQASIRDLALETGVCEEDVVSTLNDLSLLTHWKGQTIITVSKPVLDAAKARARKVRLADPACLVWTPPPTGSSKDK